MKILKESMREFLSQYGPPIILKMEFTFGRIVLPLEINIRNIPIVPFSLQIGLVEISLN